MSLVLEGRPYYNFINSLHSEPTKKTYRYTLVRFMRFYQLLSVDKLLDLSSKDQCIIDYLLSQKGYQSKALSLNAIKKFYEMNDIILNWKKISCYLGAKQKNKNRGYTHEEIQQVLAISDQRMKMIILLLSSSGVRVGRACLFHYLLFWNYITISYPLSNYKAKV
jgi:integrase